MRIHGVHLNGLDSPRGAHQLACEPGYTVVVCPDVRAARRLMAVVRALLCDPGALRGSGRVDVSLSFGRDAYRLVADLVTLFARGTSVQAQAGVSPGSSSSTTTGSGYTRAWATK